MSNAIEVEGLEKTFKGDIRALCGVTFSVEAGTIFGLLGPNGAGKTTVIRILTTILHPDAGAAFVLGHNVATEAPLVRTLFGLAGQYAAVDEKLTGRENLSMVGRLNHLDRPTITSRSNELLDEFQLSDAADRPLQTYSGGMRRRLDLAAALVARPSILFLDEPTTGLDPHSRSELWQIIEGLVESGTTVLLTTQYLEEADRLTDHIAIVDHGRVISQGTSAALKAELGTTVLEIGLADVATAVRAGEALVTTGSKPPHIIDATVELSVDDGPRVAMEALRALDQMHIEPITFALREPSLDDVFLDLTGKPAQPDASEVGPDTAEPRNRRRRTRKSR
jgi:daunorubicin resistance ABC transporter ATP-binding subunit